ncbi:hypothetical protein KAH43_07420 [Candidatus Bipolaricaulota bacterium]|nr:hypothetical protein [Candidatus Bipolaricaulota bacterium]
MKTAGIVALACLFLCSLGVLAVQIDSFSLGFHFIPSVELVEGRRVLDMTMSFGGTLGLDSENTIDLMAITDSGLSSFGISAQFTHQITVPLKAGFGVTVIWPFTPEQKLAWPILGTYGYASARTYFYQEFWAETAVSFPLLTLANQVSGWKLLPLSELPTINLAADVRFLDAVSVQPRLTFQPVITDTTALNRPLGRISDDLLIIPMGSIFLRYLR